jgi:hypothetical protein
MPDHELAFLGEVIREIRKLSQISLYRTNFANFAKFETTSLSSDDRWKGLCLVSQALAEGLCYNQLRKVSCTKDVPRVNHNRITDHVFHPESNRAISCVRKFGSSSHLNPFTFRKAF